MNVHTIKDMKIEILKEEARLIRLKKQGFDVDLLIQKVKEIKMSIIEMEAKMIRVQKTKTLYSGAVPTF